MREYKIPLAMRRAIAKFFLAAGRKPGRSTSIADTPTSGYG